jgi:hypothetical protein
MSLPTFQSSRPILNECHSTQKNLQMAKRSKTCPSLEKLCCLQPTHLQLDAIGCHMQLKWLHVQLHLNFRWFSVTSVFMLQLVFPSSFKIDDFYTLITCYYTHNIHLIYTNTLPKNLSSKIQFDFFCLN